MTEFWFNPQNKVASEYRISTSLPHEKYAYVLILILAAIAEKTKVVQQEMVFFFLAISPTLKDYFCSTDR